MGIMGVGRRGGRKKGGKQIKTYSLIKTAIENNVPKTLEGNENFWSGDTVVRGRRV